ncbi:MAG: anaerobic ribonucleoside-triphosphate reductase activating protein [Methanobacteriota archaeon]
MKIGGLQKTSLLDYPDNVSAIVWTIGCNFRCPFCYNKAIALGTTLTFFPEEEIIQFLEKRQGLLDGVVITGGEPLLQEGIIEFVRRIKQIGYRVKIDTNGSQPEKLLELIKQHLVDYIAMDIKAPRTKYDELAGIKVDLAKIAQSIELIKNAGIDYEFRTTVVPDLLKQEDIVEIAQWIQGAKRYFLQQFRINPPLVSSKLEKIQPYTKDQLQKMCDAVKSFVQTCYIRGV